MLLVKIRAHSDSGKQYILFVEKESTERGAVHSTARKILLSAPIDFYVPEFAFEEIEEHIKELSKKNKLPVLHA